MRLLDSSATISEPKVSITIIASNTVTRHSSLLREVADRPFKPILLLTKYSIFRSWKWKFYGIEFAKRRAELSIELFLLIYFLKLLTLTVKAYIRDAVGVLLLMQTSFFLYIVKLRI